MDHIFTVWHGLTVLLLAPTERRWARITKVYDAAHPMPAASRGADVP